MTLRHSLSLSNITNSKDYSNDENNNRHFDISELKHVIEEELDLGYCYSFPTMPRGEDRYYGYKKRIYSNNCNTALWCTVTGYYFLTYLNTVSTDHFISPKVWKHSHYILCYAVAIPFKIPRAGARGRNGK